MSNDKRQLSTSPAQLSSSSRAKQIAEFWNSLRTCEELDTAIWEVLEPIERQVTEYLDRSPPLLTQAESVTAQVMIMLAGKRRP